MAYTISPNSGPPGTQVQITGPSLSSFNQFVWETAIQSSSLFPTSSITGPISSQTVTFTIPSALPTGAGRFVFYSSGPQTTTVLGPSFTVTASTTANTITTPPNTTDTSTAVCQPDVDRQVSTQICSSLYPSISFARNGFYGVAWQDARDGAWEIYAKFYNSLLGSATILTGSETLLSFKECPAGSIVSKQIQTIENGQLVLKNTDPYIELANRCATGLDATSTTRYPGCSLTVSYDLMKIVLTATGIDFGVLGIGAGKQVKIESGTNKGKTFTVVQRTQSNTLELVYDPTAQSDPGPFEISVVGGVANCPGETCEFRMTCNKASSLFPDITADGNNRYHIVYQDNESGKFQINYIQVAPKALGLKKGCKPLSYDIGDGKIATTSPDSSFVNSVVLDFTEVPSTTIGAVKIWVIDQYRYYLPSGDPGDILAFGDGTLSLPTPNQEGQGLSGTGYHWLFKDAVTSAWTGVSSVDDRTLWEQEILSATGSDVLPVVPVTIGANHPVAKEGDFGSSYPIDNVAFMLEAPPELDLRINKIRLPFSPAFAPLGQVSESAPLALQSIVSAPRKPLPPTYIDPIDVSRYLANVNTKIDESSPERFTVEGVDNLVFTNVLLNDVSGQWLRVVFQQQQPIHEYKFILGFLRCGSDPCALTADATLEVQTSDTYDVQMQIWKGPDYRNFDFETVSVSAEKVFEKTFSFEPGQNVTNYVFDEDFIIKAGQTYFVTITTPTSLPLFVQAIGGGHSVWTSDGLGTFSQYFQPWTLVPFKGLYAPVYYDGELRLPEGATQNIPVQMKSIILSHVNAKSAWNAITPFKPQRLQNMPGNSLLAISVFGSPSTYKIAPIYKRVSPSIAIVSNPWASSNYTGGSTAMTNGEFLMIQSTGQNRTLGNVITPVMSAGMHKLWVSKSANNVSTEAPTLRLVLADLPLDDAVVGMDMSGDDLIVVLTSGKIYRAVGSMEPTILDMSGIAVGTATLVTTIQDTLVSGCLVLPVDTDTYGSWSGKILVGGSSDFWIVDPETGESEVSGIGIAADRLILSLPGNYLYAIDSSYDSHLNDNGSLKASATVAGLGTSSGNFGTIYRTETLTTLGDYAGQIIVSEKTGAIWRVALSKDTNDFSKVQIASLKSVADIAFSKAPFDTEAVTTTTTTTIGQTIDLCGTSYIASVPLAITSIGENTNPRMVLGQDNDIWMVWASKRYGTEEVYAAKYDASCGMWQTLTMGGADIKLSTASLLGGKAVYPKVTVDRTGEVHVVWMGNNTANGSWQIFYTQSVGGGSRFLDPIVITSSPGDAMMPDIAVSYENNVKKVTVVWHDTRFGSLEIMAAVKIKGVWKSSAHNEADIRITNATGDSSFPRIAADTFGALKVVYHDTRNGEGKTAIYMSSYNASTQSWECSGQSGIDQFVSHGAHNSWYPDIEIDPSNTPGVVWHDDRLSWDGDVPAASQNEEVFLNYCPGSAELVNSVCATAQKAPPRYSVITTYDKTIFVQAWITDRQGVVIDNTNTPDIFVKITSANALFYRIVEDNQPGQWQEFNATVDSGTTTVPWKLKCKNGVRQLCVQVQDDKSVSFPVCLPIILAIPEPDFGIELFADPALTIPLPMYKGWPAAASGRIYMRISTEQLQPQSPTFDVILRGNRSIFNQTTTAVAPTENGAKVFTASFSINKQDGLFNVDGLSRIVVRPQGQCEK